MAIIALVAPMKALHAAPLNDNFANATDLGTGSAVSSVGNNIGATLEAGERDWVSASVWWKWTPSVSGNYYVDLSNTEIVAQYTISTGPSVTAQATQNQGVYWNTSPSNPAMNYLSAGTTYYIAVYSYQQTQGTIRLSVYQRPVNDDFANATDLGNASAASALGSNFGATLETGEANPVYVNPSWSMYGAASVWWKWTAPTSGTYYVDPTGSTLWNSMVMVSTGASPTTLTQVGAAAYGGAASFSAIAGTTYNIAVRGINGGTGSIKLAIFEHPVNNNYANATDLGNGSAVTAVGTNLGATLEKDEANPITSSDSIWWKWTAPASGTYTLDPKNANWYAIQISTGSSLSALNRVVLSASGQVTTFPAVAGSTYSIGAYGSLGIQGQIRFWIGPTPANDNFANAVDLGNASTVSVPGNNEHATFEVGELNPTDPSTSGTTPIGGSSVWWKWTAPSNGRFFAKTSPTYLPGSGYISAVTVVSTGNSVAALSQVGLGVSNNNTAAGFTASAGTTYYIAVHGSNGSQGNFALEIGQSPVNDNFADAIMLGNGGEVSTTGSNIGATLEAGEVNPVYPENSTQKVGGSSVWWKWTAPSSGKYAVDFFGNDQEDELDMSAIVVGTGTSVSSLSQVGMGVYGQPAAFSAVAGTTYSIAVHGFMGMQGTFGLSIGLSPANDNVADAIPIAGGRALTVSGNTAHATTETGEMLTQGRSIWWEWTAPANVMVTADTAGSTLGTNLAVMQASTTPPVLSSMTIIESGESSDSEPADASFQATAGQVYYFGVSTSFGEPGGTVNLRLATPPANDDEANATNLGSNSDQTVTGDNMGATSEMVDRDGEKSVWWKYTESVGGKLQVIDTKGSSFDTVLEVYTGPSTSSLTRLLRRCDDAGDDGHSRVAFPVTSGSTYYVRVYGKNGAAGNLTLNLKSYAPATTAAGHILWARAFMETLDGKGGAAAADEHLVQALTLETANREANVLRAFTLLALLQEDPEFAQLLVNIGASKTGGGVRTTFALPKDSSGVPVTAPGSSTTLLVQYLQNRIPTLNAIDALLDKVSGADFLTSISDAENGKRYAKIDNGDVLIIRSLLRAIKAASYFSQTYDMAVSLDTVIQQSRYHKFNPEQLKSTYTKVLKFTSTDRRNDFRDSLKEAIGRYQSGSDYAQTHRAVPNDPHHLYPIKENEANIRSNATSFTAALDGATVWNGTRVDLSKLITSGSSLRDFMMNFRQNYVIANTTPDPMFGGILPDSTQDKVNDFFRKKGMLYDISSYAQWAAQLLPGRSEEEQKAEANPAHDGINNRMKYAFGLDPSTRCSNSEYLVHDLVKNASDNKKYLTVSFVRRIDTRDLGYVVAVSDDLKTWDRTQTKVEQVGAAVPNEDGITETVSFRLSASTSVTSRMFVRIEVTVGNP